MSQATLAATFLVVFRETLEASLIIGIIVTLLARLKARRYFSHVGTSSALAVFTSFLVGIWMVTLTDSVKGQVEKLLAGMISLLASGVLTYMVFWMDRQGRQIKSDLEAKVETALSRQDYLAIISLPFFAVLREGAETILFLKAVSLQVGSSVSWLGGIAGFLCAVLVACLIFIGGKKIPLRLLFRTTGFLVLIIAAGLLAYGIHELEEIGWVTPLVSPIWNINSILNEKEGLGSFLKALFGYNGNPSLTEVLCYWSYLFFVLWTLARRGRSLQSS